VIRYFIARGETTRLDDAARASLRGSFVRLSDGVTHYELTGPNDGELIVLIPGITIPLCYRDRVADRLHGSGFRTLAFSAYGRGYSDRVRATYDDPLFVGQLDQLVDALGLSGPRHVVGTSMGALVAMASVLSDPGSASTLTLIGPAGLSNRPPALIRRSGGGVLTALLGRYLGRRGLLGHLSHNVANERDAAALREMVTDAYRYKGSMCALFSTVIEFPLTDRRSLYRDIAQHQVPTLLLWGENDQVTPSPPFPRPVCCSATTPQRRSSRARATWRRWRSPARSPNCSPTSSRTRNAHDSD
jgi:pimeloyl-ACP methyl ester carboxylesterase